MTGWRKNEPVKGCNKKVFLCDTLPLVSNWGDWWLAKERHLCEQRTTMATERMRTIFHLMMPVIFAREEEKSNGNLLLCLLSLHTHESGTIYSETRAHPKEQEKEVCAALCHFVFTAHWHCNPFFLLLLLDQPVIMHTVHASASLLLAACSTHHAAQTSTLSLAQCDDDWWLMLCPIKVKYKEREKAAKSERKVKMYPLLLWSNGNKGDYR